MARYEDNGPQAPKGARLAFGILMICVYLGVGLVHSVAPDAQVAIVLAGHAGNSGFWLNEFNGKWSTSTYYRDVPAATF